MTDNSNFVVRLEIDNPSILHTTVNKVESKVFYEGGFRWTAAFQRRGPSTEHADYILKCGGDHNRDWKCDTEVTLAIPKSNGTKATIDKFLLSFHADNNYVRLPLDPKWCLLINDNNLVNGKITMEFQIRIINSERGELIADPDMFSVPNRRSDVILKIGEKKLHVSKEYLSIHSPVLETLFFGEFTEKGKEEVELKDIDYEEFLDLLHLIYPRAIELTDRIVPHILKLADRFQMECLMKESENHLIRSNGFDVVKKLLFADQYRLSSLKDFCLNLFTDVINLVDKLKSNHEYENLSDVMKAAVCDRMLKIR